MRGRPYNKRNMTDKLQAIREKCEEANREKFHTADCYCGLEHDETIRLADVLLAIAKSKKEKFVVYSVDQNGLFYKYLANWRDQKVKYDLRNDDVSEQSQEFIDFLYSLLCV